MVESRPLRGSPWLVSVQKPVAVYSRFSTDRQDARSVEDAVLEQSEARLAVFRYIEGWCNPHRRHSALDYQSPVNYERKHLAA